MKGTGSTETDPKTRARFTTFTRPRGKRTTRAAGASPFRAAALLIGALLCAVLSGPAEAQTRFTIWSANLTVDNFTRGGVSIAGCSNLNSLDDCSSSSALSDDDFSYHAGTWTIIQLYMQTSNAGGTQSRAIHFFTNEIIRNTVLHRNGRLVVGSGANATSFDFSSANVYQKQVSFVTTISAWNDNDTVSLSITVTDPPAPTGVSASANDSNEPTLSWTAITGATAYEYRYKEKASGACGTTGYSDDWISAGTGTSHKLTSYVAGKRNCLQVRAKAGTVAGPAAAPVVLHPPLANLSVTPQVLGGKNVARVSWTGVAGAKGYQWRYYNQSSGRCDATKKGKSWESVNQKTPYITTNFRESIGEGNSQCVQVRAAFAGNVDAPASPFGQAATAPVFFGMPGNLTARGGYRRIVLTWDAVTNATRYQYQSKVQPSGACGTSGYGNWKRPLSRGARISVGGLSNGTRYCFRVRALSGDTPGPVSAAIAATPREKGLVVEPRTLTIVEGGQNAYTVKLDTRPLGTVKIRLFLNPFGICDKTFGFRTPTQPFAVPGQFVEFFLLFTPSNWNQPQRVTVRADEDGPPSEKTPGCPTEETDGRGRLEHQVRSTADPAYDHGGDVSYEYAVELREYDNDIAGRQFGFRADPNPVREGEVLTLSLFRPPPADTALSVGAYFGTGEWDGTAEMGDWGGACGGFRFEQDQRTATCAVTAAHDADADDEWFSVSLGPSGQDLGDPLRITILDDDGADETTVSLEASAEPVREGEWTEVAVRLSRALASGATIPLVVTPRSAEDTDWEWHEGATARILPGERSDGVWLRGVHDEDADDETLEVSLGTLPEGLRAGAAAAMRLTIYDDEESVGAGAAGNAGRNMLAYWDRDGNHGLTCCQEQIVCPV